MKQSGIKTFYILTITQVFSIIGSMMTGIAIGIKIFNDTGESTPLLLVSFFSAIPPMIGGSLAGVVVDRWNRKRVLIISDIAQTVGTVLLLLSFYADVFELWHLYAIVLAQSFFGMVQRPAMEASVTMLVPDNHRDRANAIRQITGPMAGIIAPPITGFVYAFIGVPGVMLIDLVTIVVAISVLFFIHIPQPRQMFTEKTTHSSVFQDLKEGFQFMWSNRILFYMMLYAAVINFLMVGPLKLMTPYIINLTGSEATLGVLLGIFDAGIVIGGILMGIWGGTRPRIHGIMIGVLFRSVSIALLGLARTPVTLGISLFFLFFTNALIDASFASIVQLKTPPDLQGRVFALLLQIMYIANPLSLLLTGPLVDRILSPMLGTAKWHWFTPLVGDQPGSEMGLVMFISGVLILVITLGMYTWQRVRNCETELPDYPVITMQPHPKVFQPPTNCNSSL